MNKISIIIPVYNEEFFIGECLTKLLEECKKYKGATEIIVVDNNSTDATRDIVRSIGLNVLISNSINSPSKVRNKGASVATGDIFAFLDGDCLVPNGWLDKINRAYADVNVGAYGGPYSAPIRDTWIVTSWNPIHVKESYNKTAKLPGGNLTVRTTTFERLGGFNEELVSAEDDFICKSVMELGELCIFDSEACVIHLGYPKTLIDIYKKQVWHGSTQIRAHGFIKDRMLLVTEIWSVSWLMLALSFSTGILSISLISCFLIIACPMAIMGNRLKYHRNITCKNVLLSTLISVFFISGRTVGLLQEIRSMVK